VAWRGRDGYGRRVTGWLGLSMPNGQPGSAAFGGKQIIGALQPRPRHLHRCLIISIRRCKTRTTSSNPSLVRRKKAHRVPPAPGPIVPPCNPRSFEIVTCHPLRVLRGPPPFLRANQIAIDRTIARYVPTQQHAPHTGPGLLEAVYEQCLCVELRRAGVAFARQGPIPMLYKGEQVGDGFKADVVVAEQLILAIKSVAAILMVHEMQRRTYLRMSGIRVGLLLNFSAPRLMDGLRRSVVQWSAH
jgi:GxxExxY protein